MPDDVPKIRLRPLLLADGHTDEEVRRRRRDGELTLLRRGAYLCTADAARLTAATRHALLVAAEVPRVASTAVVSHVSAAVLHGLPLWAVPMHRVHVTRARRNGARRGSAVYVHAAPLVAEEIVEVGGVSVTSVPRTVVDLARTLPFEPAVVIADAALRTGQTSLSSLMGVLERCGGWPGVPAARRVVRFADGRSESVGESRSRAAMREVGLPPPALQWKVWRGGQLLGRCDFGWPERGVVGEFDGRVKYGRLLRPGQEPGEVVFEEKLREDGLRAEGLSVVRWTWRDLDAFHPTSARLRAALRTP